MTQKIKQQNLLQNQSRIISTYHFTEPQIQPQKKRIKRTFRYKEQEFTLK